MIQYSIEYPNRDLPGRFRLLLAGVESSSYAVAPALQAQPQQRLAQLHPGLLA
jgi:hypothetical protein